MDELTQTLKKDGYEVLSGLGITVDGYYEKYLRKRKTQVKKEKDIAEMIGHSYDISDEKYIEQVVKYLREEKQKTDRQPQKR